MANTNLVLANSSGSTTVLAHVSTQLVRRLHGIPFPFAVATGKIAHTCTHTHARMHATVRARVINFPLPRHGVCFFFSTRRGLKVFSWRFWVRQKSCSHLQLQHTDTKNCSRKQ